MDLRSLELKFYVLKSSCGLYFRSGDWLDLSNVLSPVLSLEGESLMGPFVGDYANIWNNLIVFWGDEL